MEEIIQRFGRTVCSSNGGDIPWYKKKPILLGGIILLGVLVLGGYFLGKSQGDQHSQDANQKSLDHISSSDINVISPEESIQAAPTGCPRPQGRCHQSYINNSPLLLISFDGFRPDYLKRSFNPTLNKIARCGTRAQFMYPVFPSKTFPNHFSIVTGLNPESHGIVDNNMYDPNSGKLFKVKNPDARNPVWYDEDPIWVTAQRQGKKTASFFWPGADVPIGGLYPTYYYNFSSKYNYNYRVDKILDWLEMPPASRPTFLTLYFNQPDNVGHHNGIYSKQVNQTLVTIDTVLERLWNGLQNRNLINCVNFIVLSDHGMSNTDCKRVVNIKDYIDVDNIFSTMGPFGRIRPKGRRDHGTVPNMIKRLRCQSEHMRVYPKRQLPVRFHYAASDRIEPIFLDMDNQWTVVTKGANPGDSICSGASHGYDNLFADMRAIFIAHGPSFKTSTVVQPFIATELYELMSEMIGITPNPNNGTKGSLHHLLKSPRRLEPQVIQDPPITADVPIDQKEYDFRVYAANCTCQQKAKQVNVADKQAKRNVHLPFGIPFSPYDNRTLRLLYNEDSIMDFDLKYRIPAWVSFTLSGKKNVTKTEEPCYIGDARIPMADSPRCGDFENHQVLINSIVLRPLFSPSFSNAANKEEAFYISNSFPKSKNHTNILEHKINEMLAQWSSESGLLNVVMGSAFDVMADGNRPYIGRIMRLHEHFGPLVVPTHIFVIATWCSGKALVDSLKDCDPVNLQTNGFLLPNQPFTHNCESAEDMIQKNVARVIDIENLTGFKFFTSLPVYDAIRLRTAMPRRLAPV